MLTLNYPIFWRLLNMTKVVDTYDIEYIAYHMDKLIELVNGAIHENK